MTAPAALAFSTVDAAGVPLSQQGIPDASGNFSRSVSLDGTIPTYTWGAIASPLATPTSFLRIQGPTASGKTLRVRSIRLTGLQGLGAMPVLLLRTSDAGVDAGGTSYTSLAATKHSTGDGNATSTVKYIGGANLATPPTTVGVLGAGSLGFTDGTLAMTEFYRQFGVGGESALVLGNGEYAFINLQGAAVPSGGQIYIEVTGEEV